MLCEEISYLFENSSSWFVNNIKLKCYSDLFHYVFIKMKGNTNLTIFYLVLFSTNRLTLYFYKHTGTLSGFVSFSLSVIK